VTTAVEKMMNPPPQTPAHSGAGPDRPDLSALTVRPITFPHAPANDRRQQPEAAPAESNSWRPEGNASHPLHQVKATLQVYLGSATLTVGELMSAAKNQLLVLDRTVGEPVDLLLEGQVVARGQLVALDDRFAVRITELPLPLDLQGGPPFDGKP
jgi:flagellar motor switch protein FliN